MPAKVLMMVRSEAAPVVVEQNPFDREIARQRAQSEQRARHYADLPDDWVPFPAGCRWVGHENKD